MSKPKDIKMFRLKCLKEDKIPKDFIVMFWHGDKVEWCPVFFDGKEWTCEETKSSETGTVLDMIQKKINKGKVWLVGWRMYEMLCWQGLRKQIENKTISFKKKGKEKDVEVLSQMFITGDPTIVDLTVNNQTVHCVDFINWAITGVEKGIVNGEDKILCGKSLSDAITALMLRIKMVQDLNMGKLSDTGAGQGLNRMRRNDLGQHAVYAHQNMEIRRLERDAWFAGRNEAWFIGKIEEPVWNLDVKSQYPFIVSTKRVPVKLLNFGDSLSINDCKKMMQDGFHVIAWAEINTDVPIYPLKHNKMTIYTTGHFLTPLCNPELEIALAKDHVLSIRKWAVYQTACIFKENSQWYFNAKQSLDSLGLSSMSGPLKQAQNSMYGNIGRRGKSWIETPKVGDKKWDEVWWKNPKNNEVCIRRIVDGVHQYLDLTGEPDTAIPAIPATIFSYGRAMIWPFIETAGIENCFYDDTDGVSVNEKGFCRLLGGFDKRDGVPGELVVREHSHDEKWKDKTVDIRGLKHYRFGDVWRQNGVPSWAERDFLGNVKFSQHVPFDLSLWHGMPLEHTYKDKKFKWKDIYKHGHVLETGRVVPLVAKIIKDSKTGEERNGVS